MQCKGRELSLISWLKMTSNRTIKIRFTLCKARLCDAVPNPQAHNLDSRNHFFCRLGLGRASIPKFYQYARIWDGNLAHKSHSGSRRTKSSARGLARGRRTNGQGDPFHELGCNSSKPHRILAAEPPDHRQPLPCLELSHLTGMGPQSISRSITTGTAE